MTYEQGGGPAGGLAVLTGNGDTLTLADRALHHYTTGLSTIEVASKNAARLVSEYEKYFREAANGVGEFKAYVVKMGENDTARMQALVDLLAKNNIRYYTGRGAGLRGFNYQSLKEESFSLAPADLVVPTTQPKGALVKVLFDQNTKLSDSATYDITAWSLPYAYGLTALATKTAIGGLSAYTFPRQVTSLPAEAPYAYVIPWTDINAARLTGQLLQKGVKLRFITQPFSAGGQTFGRGSVLIIRAGNPQPGFWSDVRTAAAENGVRLVPVQSGFVDRGSDFGSASVLPLKARKVALFTGEGISSLAAGEVWYYFEQVLNFPVSLINVADAGRLNWSDYDVVVMPDGAYRFLTEKSAADALRLWISNGGNLVAMEGAVNALSRLDWAVKAKKGEDSGSKSKDPYENLRRYDDRERSALRDYTPGSIYKIELDNSHPLAFGYPAHYHSLKMDNRQFDFLKDGWNVGVVKRGGPVAGFVGTDLSQRLQNHLVFGVQELGRGTVTYFTDNVLFRSFWENGKLLFANAVLLVGQ
jgi:hypothetical protein